MINISKNWKEWTFNLLKRACLVGLCYFIIKLATSVEVVNEIKIEHEKYYLAAFVTLFSFMHFIFYDFLAKRLRKYFHNRRIRRKHESIIDQNEVDLGTLAELSLKVVLWLGLATKKELKEMGEIEKLGVTERELDSTWFKVSKVTSNLLCLFINATLTAIVAWGISAYYALPILFGIILVALGLTYVIMSVINNVEAINKLLDQINNAANNLGPDDEEQLQID